MRRTPARAQNQRNTTSADLGFEAQLWAAAEAWVQHMIHDLAPAGLAGFLVANASMSANQSGEGEISDGEHEDAPGFRKSATLEEIRRHGYALTPGRYVGALKQEEDDEPFAAKRSAWLRNSRPNKPRPGGWTRPSGRTPRSWAMASTWRQQPRTRWRSFGREAC